MNKKIIFVDPVAKCVVEEKPENLVNGLPAGWMVPTLDVARATDMGMMPHGVVVAFSSEDSFQQALVEKLQGKEE